MIGFPSIRQNDEVEYPYSPGADTLGGNDDEEIQIDISDSLFNLNIATNTNLPGNGPFSLNIETNSIATSPSTIRHGRSSSLFNISTPTSIDSFDTVILLEDDVTSMARETLNSILSNVVHTDMIPSPALRMPPARRRPRSTPAAETPIARSSALHPATTPGSPTQTRGRPESQHHFHHVHHHVHHVIDPFSTLPGTVNSDNQNFTLSPSPPIATTTQTERSPSSNRLHKESSTGNLKTTTEPRDTLLTKGVCNALYNKGFLAGRFSDVTIHALGASFNLHKLVLIQNHYFEGMWIGGPWVEVEKRDVNLHFDDPYISASALSVVFSRMYGNTKVEITSNNACELMATASFFNDTELVDIAVEYITQNTTAETILQYIEFANQYYGPGTDTITDSCFTFLCREGHQFNLIEPKTASRATKTAAMKQVFSHLSLEWLERVLSADCFYIPNEFERYKIIKSIILERCHVHKTPLHVPSSTLKIDSSVSDPSDQVDIDSKVCIGNEDYSLLLNNAIVYANLEFSDLQAIRKDALVTSSVLQRGLWRQNELKGLVEGAMINQTELDISYDLEDGAGLFVPADDTDKIDGKRLADVLKWPLFSHLRVRFPPFRFGCEFGELKKLHGEGRMYSKTMSYAGSHWVIYLQKINVEQPKLGVYLQRWLPEDTNGDTVVGADGTNVPNVQYIDKRLETKTWFKLYCFFSRKCYVLESKPDVFKSTQSWGWRSAKLYKDAFNTDVKDEIVRCCVVMGHV
ncbi:hypothetical protein HK096_010895 [Nowakowskiella sp. JEL0078]|nr:hypothetical protein HK096_010895 [Nowakowskiella sp. JEL0078]